MPLAKETLFADYALPRCTRRESRSVRIALVSDIHANIEALEAVLKDIEAYGCDKVYCLGDLLDYGPNPREVLDLAMERFSLNLLGNHEEAVMLVAEDFNERAMRSVEWTREQLNNPDVPKEKRHAYWNFLDAMNKVRSHRQGDLLFVHGSPRKPTHEYVFPKDSMDEAKIRGMFAKFDRFCFCGHSHIPGIYSETGKYGHPKNLNNGEIDLRRFRKLLINIGSVGQPRDHDTRACYVVLDGNKLIFRRVPYDHESTANKIRAIDRLPAMLADRLLQGK
ncbi:MAG: metallophosphoesterase family protein [Planctomycetes bacterium]|nr:metallophosphoesterase family protein [Planctomycetota bacterium]